MQLLNELMLVCDATLRRHSAVKVTNVAWAIARNRAKLDKPIEDLKKQIEPTEAMKAFSTARNKLVEAHAEKTAAGEPKRTPIMDQPGAFRYQIAHPDALEIAQAALRQEHPQAEIDEQALTKKEEELLRLTTDFEPYKIKRTEIPDGILDAEAMLVFFKCGILED
jgi:hypothetical protein